MSRQQMAQAYPNAMPAGAMPMGPAALPVDDRKKSMAVLAAIVLILAALGLMGLYFSLKAVASAPKPDLKAIQSPGAPALSAARQGMPDDVWNYLEHVRKTEDMRMALAKTQVTKAVVDANLADQTGIKDNLQGLMSDDSETDKPRALTNQENEISSMKQSWNDLNAQFNSIQPPPECQNIHDKYDETIRETGGAIMDITDTMTNAMNDPQDAIRKLKNISDESSERIDKPGRVTDQLIQDICSKYNVRKWFDIHSDIGTSAMQKVTLPDPLGGG